jgi:3-oxoacyl-[acyl-carrier protein] reductase
MDSGLAGRTVLITGAAGGIGHAMVRAFAAEGARVAAHFRTRADEAARLVASLPGAGHFAVGADLSREDEADALFDRIEREAGRCDVLVANAGHWPADPTPLIDLPAERWRATLEANLTATFLSCRGFLRLVRRTGGPADAAVVMVGSTAGIFGEAGHSDYAAAKGALHTGLLKSLKNEITAVAPAGRVNAVCPGWTVTDKNRHKLTDPAVVGRVLATRPQRRVARPEDIAAAAVFLASPALAGHLTGEHLTVAGGMEGRLLNDPGPTAAAP